MKQSQLLIPTMKETPADAESISHKLLLRAGFIRQNAAGIYSYLPLGYRVLRKIEEIVREEMERAGAVELLMPAIQPAELWQQSGRWEVYGPELMRLKDRHGRDFALGATHEEIITSLVRDELNSYKKLPMTLYQIQTKYRDERRPRFGLLRGREFIMKDAYSFHATQEGLDERYQIMYDAYTRVFSRCGLNFRPVIADSGAIGGKDTHEFMAFADIGEDTIAYSDVSNYAANIEMAEVKHIPTQSDEDELPLDKGQAISGDDRLIMVQWFKVNDQAAAVLHRAGDEINDVKVKNHLNATMVDAFEGHPAFNLSELKNKDVILLADNGVQNVVNGVIKEGEQVAHFNVNADRDLKAVTFGDFRFIKEGDPSPDGEGTIHFTEGIEIGQVFKLGTKYSESMGANFLDENGRSHPMIMGCYGIGISRTLSAVAEQYHDDRGLIWPASIAPFQVHIVPVNVKNEEQKQLAVSLYNTLSGQYEVLLDDRDERAGVKFAEAELIGCPVRITVGKRASEGIVEVSLRSKGDKEEVSIEQLPEFIKEHLK
ncbi:proline--tRNA ligase [Pullulanibacillus sp. KACC 23026]|uniref:proline--tRNA ligase n=1 Tax=Pullulanibacillus sp. KACC 23026 TaxID=3028315 RepID=UPI0023AF14BB|nr:proline--tRNA ligase [Pullulanibacillus sp. KACC 23026]WEG11587.1 proline--tRNA ligase [Pullulanibacillus sp. KACC 23026]